jgi:hypothetical protein
MGNNNSSFFKNINEIKNWVERIGLVISLGGLASILQPFSLTIYTLGFYILIIGATIYFIGSTIPEESTISKTVLQIVSILSFFVAIILLAVYLAPFLII